MKRKTEAALIIEKILLEATANGGEITEDELIRRLDEIPDFWEVARAEELTLQNIDKGYQKRGEH